MQRNTLRGVARAMLLAAWTCLMVPPSLFSLLLLPRLRPRLIRFYFHVACLLCGLNIRVNGTPSRKEPVLFVGNHISYFDVLVLGSLVRASFVAKSDIASWPLIGHLCGLAQTVFVKRTRGSTVHNLALMRAQLRKKRSMVIFPEGTTGDGSKVHAFKSGLLDIAMQGQGASPKVVQPFSIAYTRVGKHMLGVAERAQVAWVGDAPFLPLFFSMLCLKSLEVQVQFFSPVPAEIRRERKKLAAFCQKLIASHLADRVLHSA